MKLIWLSIAFLIFSFYPRENLFPASQEVLKAYGLVFHPIEEYDYAYEKGHIVRWNPVSAKNGQIKYMSIYAKSSRPSPIRFARFHSYRSKFSPQFQKLLSLYRSHKMRELKTLKTKSQTHASGLKNYPFLYSPKASSKQNALDP